MDFMSDELFDGRRIRMLTIVDHFTRESLAIEVDGSLGGQRVVEALALPGSGGQEAKDHIHRQRSRIQRPSVWTSGRTIERCGSGLQSVLANLQTTL